MTEETDSSSRQPSIYRIKGSTSLSDRRSLESQSNLHANASRVSGKGSLIRLASETCKWTEIDRQFVSFRDDLAYVSLSLVVPFRLDDFFIWFVRCVARVGNTFALTKSLQSLKRHVLPASCFFFCCLIPPFLSLTIRALQPAAATPQPPQQLQQPVVVVATPPPQSTQVSGWGH